MIRVLLVEDQTMMRDALASLLALEPDIDVVGALGRGDEALPAAERLRPDVALLDIELPGLDGLTIAEGLAERVPSCRVIIVTTFGRPGYLRRALAANVAGFVLKETPAAELASTVRRAGGGPQLGRLGSTRRRRPTDSA
jgi:two-component system response regulator DesR